MSIELENPKTLVEKIDAASNYVSQMLLAKISGDDVHFREAYGRSSRLLFEACRMAEEIDRSHTVVTCVYCGLEYPDGTPAAKAEALTAHVKACDKHPMKRIRSALAALVGADTREELEGMRAAIGMMRAPDSEKASMIEAIDSLLDTI